MNITKLLTISSLLIQLTIIAVECESFNKISGYIPPSSFPSTTIKTGKGDLGNHNKPTALLNVQTDQGLQMWKLPEETTLARQDDEKEYELIQQNLIAATLYGQGTLCHNTPKAGNYTIIFGKKSRTMCDDFKKWLEEKAYSNQK